MKLLLFTTTLIIVAYATAKPRGPSGKNHGPALADQVLAKRDETRIYDGYQLRYGCYKDTRYTSYTIYGRCWSYCGASWTSGEWCYTEARYGTSMPCVVDKDCFDFVDNCIGACSLF